MATLLDSFLFAIDIKLDESKAGAFTRVLSEASIQGHKLNALLKELNITVDKTGNGFTYGAKKADDFGEHTHNAGEQAKATTNEINKLNKSTRGFGDAAKLNATEGAKTLHSGLVNLRYGALAVVGALTGIVGAVALTENKYEKLAYTAQRANSSVGGLQALAYGVAQQGGTREGAISSAEGLGSFLRSTPGAASFLQTLGVHATGANGQLRDTSALLRELGNSFKGEQARGTNYATIKAQAGVLGIDETTLQALMRGVGQFSGELDSVYKKIGFNADAASRRSVAFMRTFREFGATLTAVKDSILDEFGPEISAQVKTVREAIVAHFVEIKRFSGVVIKGIMTFGRFVLFVFKGAISIVSDLLGWFDKPPDSIQTIIEAAAGIGAAFAILGGPITLVTGLGAAISALYLDYKQWKSGAKSFIDWGPWKKDIDNVLDGFKDFKEGMVNIFKFIEPIAKTYLNPVIDFLKGYVIETIHRVSSTILGLGKALEQFSRHDFTGAWETMKSTFSDNWEAAKKAGGNFAGLVGQEYNQLSSDLNDVQIDHISSNNQDTIKNVGNYIMKAFGTDSAHASGIVGNVMRESGFNPSVSNDKGGGHYGLFQWSRERALKILEGVGIDVMHPTGNRERDIQDQIKAFQWEVTRGKEAGEFSRFLHTKFKSGDEAAYHFSNGFERPEEDEKSIFGIGTAKRRKYAEAAQRIIDSQSMVQNRYSSIASSDDNSMSNHFVANITVNANGGNTEIAQAVETSTQRAFKGIMPANNSIRHAKMRLG